MPKFNLNTILYGPPGTGKTYLTKTYASDICAGKNYNELIKSGNVAFTTFHQPYGYEEFIEGIKPIMDDTNIKHKVTPGVFKKFCDEAKNRSNENFVFIIDEINRGNISKIFGELITLIE